MSERVVEQADKDLSMSMARRNGLIRFNLRAGKAVSMRGQVSEAELDQVAQFLEKEKGTPGPLPETRAIVELRSQFRDFARQICEMLGGGKVRAPKKLKKVKGVDKTISKISKLPASDANPVKSLSKEVPKSLKELAKKSKKGQKNITAKLLSQTKASATKSTEYEVNEFGELVKKEN